MLTEDCCDYHRRRAEKEIDLALASSNLQVARAHFALARLHAEQLRALAPFDKRPLIMM